MKRILLASLLCAPLAALAEPVLPVAPSEPSKQVTDLGKTTVEELRRNGQLQQITVTPDNAPAYQLLDTEHGVQPQSSTDQRPVMTPSWQLLTF